MLDPASTTATVAVIHGYCVPDMLCGVNGAQQPQVVQGATVSDDGRTRLKRRHDGLRFQ